MNSNIFLYNIYGRFFSNGLLLNNCFLGRNAFASNVVFEIEVIEFIYVD
jgi:hypothetical protein